MEKVSEAALLTQLPAVKIVPGTKAGGNHIPDTNKDLPARATA